MSIAGILLMKVDLLDICFFVAEGIIVVAGLLYLAYKTLLATHNEQKLYDESDASEEVESLNKNKQK